MTQLALLESDQAQEAITPCLLSRWAEKMTQLAVLESDQAQDAITPCLLSRYGQSRQFVWRKKTWHT